jgi:rare lipoprotein A
MNLSAIIRRGCWVLLSCVLLLAGCSGTPSRAPVDSSAIINPERGSRGNPPSYEVFGQRYFVMNSSEGYREHGIASWYGRDFHGRPTSSGEIYDMNLLTAAHKTLPLPTWVEVTNVSNGRRVIVKVNDRGPFVGDRIIDLSQRGTSA